MADAIPDRVLRFLDSAGSSEPFDPLALEVFAYQLAENAAYRAWCDALGVSPASVTSVAAIPAVPVAAFKELELVCGTPAAEFRTSGTTGTGRGRHLLPDLEPYRISALTHFGRCLLPEGWKLRTLALVPPPDLRPHSSLSRMAAWIMETFGEPGSGWFIGADGLERDRLAEALLDAQRGGVPVLILATSAALIAFLDYADVSALRVALTGGSRLMDTGGQKGARLAAPVPADAFQESLYRRVAGTLGIPPDRCVNEYGMTELTSQAYDRTLADPHGTLDVPRVKLPPPWLSVSAVDPVTLEAVPPGQSGLLRFVDLANVGSVIAVQTEDFGRLTDGGFILEGRPRAAEARGCGLTFEALQSMMAAP